MTSDDYAKNITAEDLRTLLELWPLFAAEEVDTHQTVIKDKDLLFNKNTEPFSWCHLYELPIKQHIFATFTENIQNFDGIMQEEDIAGWLGQVIETPGQIGALPSVIDQIGNHFDDTLIAQETAESIIPNMASALGTAASIFNTMRCVLHYGSFLNELIDHVRSGDDKALFNAVRIDPTALGCKPVIERISKATLLKDEEFFDLLKKAINSPKLKLEQANYQMMRLVFEVLHEAGASRLTNDQLRQLFVTELDLYSGNEKGGGCRDALREFADNYMKKNTTI
jgi:hypothetical protein